MTDEKGNGVPDRQAASSASIPLLSLAAAASQLGISERTARRWVKTGRVKAVRVPNPQGFTYGIPPDAITEAQQPTDGVVGYVQTDGQTDEYAKGQVDEHSRGRPNDQTNDWPQELVALIRDLQEKNHTIIERLQAEHQAAVAHLHEENRQLAGQLGFVQAERQQLQEQMKLLQAPPEKPRRRWWRRLWPIRRRNADASTSDGREQATGEE